MGANVINYNKVWQALKGLVRVQFAGKPVEIREEHVDAGVIDVTDNTTGDRIYIRMSGERLYPWSAVDHFVHNPSEWGEHNST